MHRSSSGRAIPHVVVCIPTFRRPTLLSKCLEALQSQKHEAFTYGIVVVDNDHKQSARAVTSAWQQRSPLSIRYEVEPVQNIALARNRALRSAYGEFIAFIDDDEIPCEDWLQGLYRTCNRYRADGVLGPVRPYFPLGAPLWLKRSGLCNRPSHETGTVLNRFQTRTGNVLFRRNIIEGHTEPFPPSKGRSGGEDMAFFRVMIENGHRFVWCEDTPVYEVVVPQRWTLGYYVMAYLRMGGLSGERARHSRRKKWRCLVLSLPAAVAYALGVAIGFLGGKHIFAKCSVKLIYHLSRIAGCLGFVPIRERWEPRGGDELVMADVQLPDEISGMSGLTRLDMT